jgi:hypothetical protein
LQRGGGEGLRLQSQECQDLCAAAAEGHLIFKTSTEDQTVDLPNKDMTKDSPRRSGQLQVEGELNLYRWKKVFIFINLSFFTFEFIKT